MYDIFCKGGPVMWPLLVCSIVALGVVFERLLWWMIYVAQARSKRLNDFFNLAEAGKFDEAIALAESEKSSEIKILLSGLAEREHGLEASLEMSANRTIENMKRHLPVLDTIITLSPLLGILGTVTGIITSFDLLGQAGIENPQAVTGGIAQALITTATGLAIAIIALLPYNALIRKVEKTTRHLEELITRFEIAVRKGMHLNEK